MFLIIFSPVLLALCGFFFSDALNKKDGWSLLASLGVGVVAVLFFVFGLECHEKESYKQGQIDALTGKIEYKLETQPDSSRIWVKTEKK